MRILHMIHSIDPAGGGPIEGIRQLGCTLVSSGEHHVEVASVDDPNARFIRDFPLMVHPIGPHYTRYGYAPRLVPWLKEHAPEFDVLVVNGIWRYAAFAVWRALNGTSTPYVVFIHGMLDPWFKREYPFKHLKKCIFWPCTDYRVLRDAAAVMFTCEEERRLARQSFGLYAAREVVTAYGTASPPSPRETDVKCLLAKHPVLRGKRIALFMGRIHPKKGCDITIKAFAKVLAKDPQWHLLIVGPDQGGLRASLSTLTAKLNLAAKVTWTGMLRGEMKRAALSLAEILVLPSHQENFGIVVAEAMSYGVPPLISDKVNIWREIREDGAGIIAGDDLEGACFLLTSWLALSEQEKIRMRYRARQSFAKRFEIHSAADELICTLEALKYAQR